MNALAALLALKNSLSYDKTQTKMIHTILEHLDFVKTATIYDVAELCYTSTASVTRLCNSLGYNSFTVFRSDLARIIDHYGNYNRTVSYSGSHTAETICSEIQKQLYQQIQSFSSVDPMIFEQAADLLHSKEEIHCFTYFFNPLIYLSLEQNLNIDGKRSFFHSIQKPEPFPTLSKNCASIFMIEAFSEYDQMLSLFKKAKNYGSPIILFSSENHSHFKNADIAIHIPCICPSFLTDATFSAYILTALSSIYRNKYIDHPTE